eukprot:29815_1
MNSNNSPTAVVTGASSGIGAGIANKLLSLGWNVCLIARRKNKLNEIANKYDPSLSLILPCDLNNESMTIAACTNITNWCDKNKTGLNLLVNNAGFTKFNQELDNPEQNISEAMNVWTEHYNVLLKAPLILTKCLVHLLRKASQNPIKYNNGIYDGSIININSIGANEVIAPSIAPYCTFKAALGMLTKLTAKEFSAKYRIRCNAIKFGAVKTEIVATGGEDVDEWTKTWTAMNPINRIGTINDSNEIMLFLADKSKSGYITGVNLNVDGGIISLGCNGNTYGLNVESGTQSKL